MAMLAMLERLNEKPTAQAAAADLAGAIKVRGEPAGSRQSAWAPVTDSATRVAGPGRRRHGRDGQQRVRDCGLAAAAVRTQGAGPRWAPGRQAAADP
jgi:hypothetical protein